MTPPTKKVPTAESLATISNVLLSAAIIAALYFGRELLVPLALAALLTFMLTPLVNRLQRWIGRIGAVLSVVAMMFAATGVAGWVLTRQAVDLANQLPGYKENIRAKLRSIQIPNEGPFTRISETMEELKKDLPGSGNSETRLKPEALKKEDQPPMPVEVVSGQDKRVEFVQEVVTPVLGPLGTAGLVVLLLVFMLLQREDLRNRMIRLIGQGRISATSRAMDDAGSRVSRYLFMQLVVNVTYGIPVAIGLYFIGVPNAILWGALSTVLRFIPYVGPWIAAGFPILLSLAVSPGWMAPMLTIGLFIGLELFSNNVMEPWLYGSSTGVTPIALIVAALVWTWLWGPVGLVLATPLTVCLVVMGRHIPRLAFLSIILSDEEPLTPAEECYHRLHRAGEHDEMELVDHYLKANSTASLFDSVLVPVITAAETDHRAGLLETEQLDFIERGLGDILNELEMRDEVDLRDSEKEMTAAVCIVPVRAHRDQLAGEMLGHLLRKGGHTAQNGSAKMVSGELVGWVRESQPDAVCISVVAPSSSSQARYLSAKLRASFPALKIIVGLWGAGEKTAEVTSQLREAGADDVVTTMAAAVERLAFHVIRPTEAVA
ncbi:AI-2E family transporter [Luteolibacter yonseiensis]|uniref:AI-2E family transporter n=1 Tax=Luteolibacter yonseiensis TaxID=1144680 RepID=A0A934VEB5_9BACT|nr:AI-2E family transporter [Luteolibacter yonseiensis]MBK1818454.1 AI-2E family transporter [Luteolibacter yonseiensis]